MTNSEIPRDLIACYQAAEYQVTVNTNITTLHIGRYSASLHQLFAKFDHQCAAFITAFNPFSQQQSRQENLTRNIQLRAALTHYTCLIFEGISTDPTKLWPAEESFFALGINLETAKALGKQFGQNAIVWIDTDAIPQLILLC